MLNLYREREIRIRISCSKFGKHVRWGLVLFRKQALFVDQTSINLSYCLSFLEAGIYHHVLLTLLFYTGWLKR